MARLASAADTVPLITGLAVATVLSGAAVFTVVSSGCDQPGRYQTRADGMVELVGGCLTSNDLPVVPQQRSAQMPPPPTARSPHAGEPSLAP